MGGCQYKFCSVRLTSLLSFVRQVGAAAPACGCPKLAVSWVTSRGELPGKCCTHKAVEAVQDSVLWRLELAISPKLSLSCLAESIRSYTQLDLYPLRLTRFA